MLTDDEKQEVSKLLDEVADRFQRVFENKRKKMRPSERAMIGAEAYRYRQLSTAVKVRG